MRRRKVPQSSEAPLAGGGQVEVVLVEKAARLFTHYQGTDPGVDFVRGAIVKVVPTADSTGAERFDLKQELLTIGAAHVWFAPRAAGVEAVAPEEELPEAPEEPPRVVIMRMVDEARTQDRDRLRAVVERALDAEAP